MDCVPFDVLAPYFDADILRSVGMVSRRYHRSVNREPLLRNLCTSSQLPVQESFTLFYKLYKSSIPTSPVYEFVIKCIESDNWYGIRNLLLLVPESVRLSTYTTDDDIKESTWTGLLDNEAHHKAVIMILLRAMETHSSVDCLPFVPKNSLKNSAENIVTELCEFGFGSVTYPFRIYQALYVVMIIRASLLSYNESVIRSGYKLLMRMKQLDEFKDDVEAEIEDVTHPNGTHLACMVRDRGNEDALTAVKELYGFNGECPRPWCCASAIGHIPRNCSDDLDIMMTRWDEEWIV